ncbi:hypothetical protein Aperf_G00000048463 [Anoplocephala perfoliata]
MDIINEPEGLLLVILNPYKDLPIYGVDFMSAYNQNSIDVETRRDPHIFAVADEAFSRMKILHQNQSVIISGESGAGKTVSAKHVLMYLTTMTSPRYCGEKVLSNTVVSMPTRVLASSPLLESLGNAKTIRNDNSSRFGKFIGVGFCHSRSRLTRAEIKTFLLEKSRVVLQTEGEKSLAHFLRVLQCRNIPDTQSRLCHRIIHTVDGDVRKRLSFQEAVSARDSLAKLTYQLLFKWIVVRCNEALDAHSGHQLEENSIGILDIYGFEVMEVNGFEQFCINFANEKLQQRFIKNVFELEQEEYSREGLEWNFVEYYDNKPCIELFEGPLGLIALLNDECKNTILKQMIKDYKEINNEVGNRKGIFIKPTVITQDESKYRLGKTKIFFGNGVLAHLERMRSARITQATTTIQRHVRGWLVRKRYHNIQQLIISMQAHARRWLALKHAGELQKDKKRQIHTIIQINQINRGDTKNERKPSSRETASQLLDLQQTCALLDAEKQELYQRLEMYQENFAMAKARQTEAQKCIPEKKRRMQKEIELLNYEKNQLQSNLSKQSTELQALKGPKLSTSSKGVVAKDDIEIKVSRLVEENVRIREQLSTTKALNRRLIFSTKYFAELVQRRAPEFLQLSTSPRFLEVQQLIAIAESGADISGFHDFSTKPKLLRCLEGREADLVNCLVNHIDITKGKSWPPLKVADLIFILLCGADVEHDKTQVSTLLEVFIKAVQKILIRQSSTYEIILFWIVNTLSLRNRINQYGGSEMVSGDESFYVLKNFDIHPFLPIFNDLIILGLQIFMEQINEIIMPQALITGALLEHEPIANLSCQVLAVSKTGGLRPQNTWLRRKPHFDRLMSTLDNIYDFLIGVHADSILVWHVFYRIFYYICSSALNSILLRKDLCNWARGAQIRYNLASLETWLSDKDLIPEENDSDFYRRGRYIRDLQLPLVQVCLLLQSKKGGSDKVKISSICNLCPNLTSTQIHRLLSRCTLVSGFEELVPPEFLAAVSRRLHEERPQKTFKTNCCGLEVSQRTLLLDSDYWRSSNEEMPFPKISNPLSDLQIPEEFDDLNEYIVTAKMRP